MQMVCWIFILASIWFKGIWPGPSTITCTSFSQARRVSSPSVTSSSICEMSVASSMHPGRQASPRLTLDLSCRKRDGKYYIVTDRWQKFTDEEVTEELLHHLSEYCDEFLIHAVDVEGKASGIETELVELLAKMKDFPVTYAGGVGSFEDLELLKKLENNHVDVTIGSALDLFGGKMKFEDVLAVCRR